jgi:glyoxylase-like metal-dependent hydrolase (beta-lactamase superfamily II)
MKRTLVLGTLVLIGALSATVAAFQQAPAPAQPGRQGGAPGGGGLQAPPSLAGLTVDKLRDNLFVIKGGGGNTAVFVTAEGVTLVDTKIYGWAPHLITRVKEITDKPVTRIINTHTHYDHTEGNPDFPATVEVVTHENTATMMPEMKAPYGVTLTDRNVFKDSNGRGLPRRTFKDDMTIGRGNDRIELHYFGRAHTSGDAFVIFPALRTMHTGDTFPNKGMPIMDINNGGSGLAYADTLARAAKVKDIDTVITGHNQTVLTTADIQTYSEFIRDFVATVRAAKKAGQSIDEVANSWKMPERFLKDGYAQPQTSRIKSNVEVLWKELN